MGDDETVKENFEMKVELVRRYLSKVKKDLLELEQEAEGLTDSDVVSRDEVGANILLSYRHVEDARMRLGKVFQACNGGESNNTR